MVVQMRTLLLLAICMPGCVSLVSVKKTPVSGGQEKIQYGLLGVDFDGSSVVSLSSSTDNQDSIQLIKLFQKTKDRELSDHHIQMLKKLQELEAFMYRDAPKPGEESDYLKEGNELMEIIKSE